MTPIEKRAYRDGAERMIALAWEHHPFQEIEDDETYATCSCGHYPLSENENEARQLFERHLRNLADLR